jgi:T5orf172 domain
VESRKKYLSLDEIIEDDDFHLIEITRKPSNAGTKSEEQRLMDSFQEITDFYEMNKREPEEGADFSETQLAYRLSGLRSNELKKEALKSGDKFNLLQKKEIKYETLDDILENDDLGIFDDDSEGLFDLKNVPKVEDRVSTDFVAKRIICKNFNDYEAIFKQVQKDLAGGTRKLLKIYEGMLQEGNFYVNNGILLFFEDFQQEKRDHIRGSSKDRKDGRTRVIFENGTESNMLFRSLYKALLTNGYAVSEHVNKVQEKLNTGLSNITEDDKESGFIYIAKSLSNKPEIREITDLYKIGFSSVSVEERVKNANQDPTYLMADVKIVSAFQCYNMNSRKLEDLLHSFFGDSCLNIDVYDNEGKRHMPREWFIAPLNVINEALYMIVSGEIINYKFDNNTGRIILKTTDSL